MYATIECLYFKINITVQKYIQRYHLYIYPNTNTYQGQNFKL